MREKERLNQEATEEMRWSQRHVCIDERQRLRGCAERAYDRKRFRLKRRELRRGIVHVLCLKRGGTVAIVAIGAWVIHASGMIGRCHLTSRTIGRHSQAQTAGNGELADEQGNHRKPHHCHAMA